jgi:hypothetical protein
MMTTRLISVICAAAGTVVFAVHCGRNDSEVFHAPPASFTATMVLECSISDDGRVATKITSDGRFAFADVANRRVAWKRSVLASSIHAVAVDPAGTLLAYSVNCRELVVENIRGLVQARFNLPGDCLDVHALAMAAAGYPIAMGAGGRGIYFLDQPAGVIRAIKPASSYRGQGAGVQSVSIDDQARWLVAGWMGGAEPEQTAFPAPSARRHAAWWHETGDGDGISVTIFRIREAAVVAELEGEQASCGNLSRDGRLLALGYADDAVSLWSMADGRRKWYADIGAGSATGFIAGERFIVAERSSPINDPFLIYVLNTTDGRVLAKARAKADIMTRGNFSARNSDKFLVAHRTGVVDVYQVSADGKTITKYWEF